MPEIKQIIDNYDVGFYAGDFIAGQTEIKTRIKRKPICDFVYKVSPYSDTFKANESIMIGKNELTGGTKK